VIKTTAIILTGFLVTASVGFGLADEKKDHICFRILDSNKDGMVTFQEFERFYDDAREEFNEADVDKDGKLTHDEYHNTLGHGSS
jgi:Ca2+-binding EF-hand superfamily protein